MNTATLPLFPAFAPTPRPIAPPAGGTEFIDLDRRQILRRVDDPRTGAVWALDPYRGCENACVHCPNRSGHKAFQLLRSQDYEQRVFVERGAAAALERHLAWHNLRGQTLSLGHFTDPYQEAEERFGITREVLEVLGRFRGLDLSISTRSTRILEDLDLLADLDRHHTVTVHLGVPTVDEALSASLEPGGATPRGRFDAVRRLVHAGIATDIRVIPLMPEINSDEESLRPLFTAALEAGAFDVVAHCLVLPPATRSRFLPWLEAERPKVAQHYRKLWGRRSALRRPDKNRALATFRRLYLEMGFPRPTISRG
ncbi:MAG: radical SAM protein [Acidobacteriota bacterium]